jgi:polysaccharide biosynthesis/export protein
MRSKAERKFYQRYSLHACVGMILLAGQLAAPPAVRTQQQAKAETPTQAAEAVSAPAEQEGLYRIGPGDVLEVRFFNRPQLSFESLRVDGQGLIQMPLIEGGIRAACRTENELAKEIATRYLKYQRNPQVNVFIKEYNSQPVAMIGAVNAPGRFQLQRRVRLLELLALTGGPKDNAGRVIQVVHTSDTPTCDAPEAEKADAGLDGLDTFSLSETMRGEVKSNPYLRPGDVISIPEAEQAFVIGNVIEPRTIMLKEPVTVSKAIAMAGGVNVDTKKEKIRIIRQLPGSTAKTEIIVDLQAIEKRQAEDYTLVAGDIVDVPSSAGKRFWRGLASAVAPAIVHTPVQVIRTSSRGQ